MARTFKIMLVALVILVLAGSAYAFAAANTIEASNAGYKASTVSGYAITNIVYGLNTDPTKLDTITFAIAPIAPNTAAAQTVMISTTTVQDFTTSTCVVDTGVATCTFTAPINVDAVAALDIVANSNP